MRCPTCESSKQEKWEKANVFKCLSCGHVWQNKINKFNYGKKYIESHKKLLTLEMSWLRLGLIAKHIRKGKLIDVGYGDGEFVRQANIAGFNAFGYDVHNDNFNIPIVKEIENCDIITMFDSLEHIKDLSIVFEFKPKFFFVTVPYYEKKFTESNLMKSKHYKPDQHLHYFTEKSIISYFAKQLCICIEKTNTEDLIRKSDNKINVMTYVFRRV